MKNFKGVLALQVESIIANLRHLQEERSNRLLRQAESQARELRRAAYRKLLQQGREAVRDERRRREKALSMAEHRIRAEAGHRMQTLYAALLSDGWPALVSELQRRWSNEQARGSWSRMLTDEALAVFGRTEWIVEHPADWTGTDNDRLGRSLAALGVPPASLIPDDTISAGLRIRHGTACLDGTIDGILADRTRVEGRLLAAWERETLPPELGHDD